MMALAGAVTFAVACYTVVAITVAEPAPQPGPGPVVAALPVFPAPGSPPVSILPSPPASIAPSPPASVPPVRAGKPTTSYQKVGNTRPGTPSASPSVSRSSAAAGSLSLGATIGLSLVDLPDHRVRSRDSLGRISLITAESDRMDRAASRFVVRAGRADSRCVSFESGVYPGFFLRHRDFLIRLERAEHTALFDRDATFCPVPVREGAAFALRSANYPDLHVTAAGDWLRLEESVAQRATAFRDTSPL